MSFSPQNSIYWFIHEMMDTKYFCIKDKSDYQNFLISYNCITLIKGYLKINQKPKTFLNDFCAFIRADVYFMC